MDQKVSYKESAPPPDARPGARSGRWFWRAGAALALAGVLGVLYWGAFEQAPRRHPFRAPDLATWLLGRMPHPGYGTMPVVPAGSAGGLVPRGLCATPEDGCGGLEIADDGRALLRFERTIELLSRVRHVRESGHLFAVGAKGDVWQLTHGSAPAWRRADLPAVEVDYNRKGGPAQQPELLATLDGHAGQVSAAAFSPDGARIVTASDDGTARLWDPATGAILAVLEGHGRAVTSVAFSPDNTRVVTGSVEGTARLWDVATGATSAILEGHGGAVTSAAFAPDGTRVITGSVDGTARLWDSATGRTSLVLEGHSDGIRSVAFSPDGTRVVTASADGTVRAWDVESGMLITSLEGPMAPVVSAAFSPDGALVVIASTEGAVQTWNLTSGELVSTFRGGSAVVSAAFSPGGTFLLIASLDGTVRVWDIGRNELFAELAALESAAMAAAFSPDGARIVTASEDGTARVWSWRPPWAVVTDLAADGAQTVWIVGRNGFAAQLGDGAAQPADAGIEGDLLSVASLALGRALAVGTDGLLVRLQRAEVPVSGGSSREGRQEQTGQQPAQQQQQQQLSAEQVQAQQQVVPQTRTAMLSTSVTRIEVAGDRDLRAVQFIDEQRGWIAGDDGLLLHTADGGETWQVLHDVGYRLSDVHVQINDLGWAAGETLDGRQVVLAAEDAASPESWSELPHYVAPWWFLAGIPALILAGCMNAWAWRLEPRPPAASITGAANHDKPLSWRDPDARVLRPVARGLSRFLRNVHSEPPLTIAITGRWGSGKSSLMNLLQEDLRRFGARPVLFNAWHHREEEHLLAALFAAVRRQGPPGWWLDRGLAFRLRLLWSRSRSTFVHLTYLLLFAAIAAITVRLSLPGFDVQDLLGRVATSLGGVVDLPDAVERYGGALLGSGGVALLALWLRARMVALPANPAKLMAALARRASLGDFSDKLSFRDRFGEQFSEVCEALRNRRSPGLVILIDDLDRCQPEDTLKVLEAVNYFVSAGPCIVVLGMDRRQVEYCIGLGFEKLVEGLPDDELLYEDELVNGAEGSARKAAKQRAFARHYLEKLINIEVPVPELSLEVLEAMLVPPEPQARQVPGGDGLTWLRSLTARLWRRIDAPLQVAGEAAPAARPHVTEPPGWLEGVKFAIATSGQVARVGVLAFVLGLLAVWGIEQVREWPEPEGNRPPAIAALQTSVPSGQVSSADSTAEAVAPEAIAPAQGLAPDLARVAPTQVGLADELPAGRRWVWWSPTVLALLIAALWGVGAFIRRDRQVVEDSSDFRKALGAVRPLLEAVNPTPRAIKRYQNRMRYLAERLRPQEYEPGAIDVFLHWLGRRLGSSIVPDVWFQDGLRTAISEPALILLGAIETYAPQAFEQPAEQVLAWLDRDERREPRTQRRREVWQEVKADFERRFADDPDAWPDAADVRLYQSFVRALGKEASRSAPPSSPGSRAVRSKPRAVA